MLEYFETHLCRLDFSIMSSSHITVDNVLDHITLTSIKQAQEQLNGQVHRTPIGRSEWLSNLIKGDVYFKLENIQVTGSFKPRGAYIKLANLTPFEKKKGVIAMSAGNHAQGVAYHAQRMGIDAVIVMPVNTPLTKVKATEKLGAKVILKGESVLESKDYVDALVKEHGYILVHPFDDPDIVTGQGTVALEMFQDQGNFDSIIMPVGGGGLASGMSIVSRAIKPDIHLYGVQSNYCTAMVEKIFPERVSSVTEFKTTLAEGIDIRFPGKLTSHILSENLDDMFVVTEEQIEYAVEQLAIKSKIISEGAGAAGVAALVANKEHFYGQTVGIVICGGNIDTRHLCNIMLKNLVKKGNLIHLNIEIIDSPGVLAKISNIIGSVGGNIYEISHQRLFNKLSVKMANVDAIVETRGNGHANEICKLLENNGFPTRRIA